ncbi:MAG: DUF3857 domain-containing protein [Maribacter dokdonensis]|uniref:DUF3857 domain-containing protein n=3 Tax=Maribacter dokdonensis TaxID=320912 RepID=UPI0032668BA6
MRLYTYLFIHLIFSITINAQKVKKTPLPNWVTPIIYQEEKEPNNEGAYKYLVLDYQDNLVQKEQFIHYAVKILNNEGIQEMSDINAVFDPAYQTIAFHKIQVIRNGEKIDKLQNATINTFQRETNLERSLYDGSLTAVINLSDIRVGDIVEYAYTLKGYNPINKGNYANLVYEEYTIPVNKIYSKILTDKNNPIFYKLLNGANEPKIENTSFGKEYSWENNSNEFVIYDSNTPYWYNVQKRISISTFNSWKDVSELLTPHYQIPRTPLKLPITIDKNLDSKQDVIVKLIRFVQDEIRYLGFEAGVGAFKPHKPYDVLNRRYGDCKDKSMLLSTLLQQQGVDAYPILVDSGSNDHLNEYAPNHFIFDHCIVYFEHDDKEYFVDPTIANQGGDLYRLSTPNYKFGLVLKEGSNQLKEIPNSTKPKIQIVEDITLDSIGGNAKFDVKTEYFGSKADEIRSYFKNNTEQNINKEYLSFYSNLYPNISSSGKVSLLDETRPYENIVTTNEHYSIEKLWNTIEGEETIYFDTNSLVLDGLVSYNNSLKRNMPYNAGIPFSFTQVTRILMPEPWYKDLKDIVIDNDFYSFKKSINVNGNMVTIDYSYELKTDIVPAKETETFLNGLDKVREDIGTQLTYTYNTATSGISWLSVFIAISAIAISIFFAFKIFKNFNPNNEIAALPAQPFGGWLILPIIGIVLTPILILAQIFDTGYFNNSIWEGFEYAGYDNVGFLKLYLGMELFYNFTFLVFVILTIILLFKKRTCTPIMMRIFYGCNLVIILLESFLLNQFGIPDPTVGSDIFRAALSAAIWIPYFLYSDRVKHTFVTTYNKSKSITAESFIKNTVQ